MGGYGSFYIARYQVGLDVDTVTDLKGAERRVSRGVLHDRYCECARADVDQGEGNAVQRDRSFHDHVAGEIRLAIASENPCVAVWFDGDDRGDSFDHAPHQVTGQTV